MIERPAFDPPWSSVETSLTKPVIDKFVRTNLWPRPSSFLSYQEVVATVGILTLTCWGMDFEPLPVLSTILGQADPMTWCMMLVMFVPFHLRKSLGVMLTLFCTVPHYYMIHADPRKSVWVLLLLLHLRIGGEHVLSYSYGLELDKYNMVTMPYLHILAMSTWDSACAFLNTHL